MLAMTTGLLLLLALLVACPARAESYTAWINVSVKVGERLEAERREGEAAPGETVNTIAGKLTLTNVKYRGHTAPSTINTLICHNIAFRAQKSGGRLRVQGIRIIESNFEGPILELVRAINNDIREKLLLEPSEIGSFVPLQLEDPSQYQLLPVKVSFDVSSIVVQEDMGSGTTTINCPGTLPLLGGKPHFRRGSLLLLSMLVLAVALALIVIGVKVLS